MKNYTFDFKGKRLEGFAQLIENKLWVYMAGETFVIDQIFGDPQSVGHLVGRGRRKNEGRIISDQVSAPMPGKITKIPIKLGDKVILGQPLVVMEAMKMEYTLKSELSGFVNQINVKLGQQVTLGEVLIRLKESE